MTDENFSQRRAAALRREQARMVAEFHMAWDAGLQAQALAIDDEIVRLGGLAWILETGGFKFSRP